ncbi:bifunctional (p)ppGpp synthetase/guanosine-3',5'-bis(diphosphate) 3'-pyrophosphohydrolase [Candidatus Uhrbacteria bacterium]|nr:bifunctional (p)ppGpp synthetase/guanosine-3',5'-bis(diphosphate) 3'-pyrophosphohydrolase [Candidatus Uhrbacteria bacterium]
MSTPPTFQRLKTILLTNAPKRDIELVHRAYHFAKDAHKGQRRASGEEYIVHPLATAITLAKMRLDNATVAAGLLHDVSDDTPITINEIEKEFGYDVAQLVSGVTKLGKVRYRGIDRYVENLRKMFVAMAQDIRVIIIKFADRLHNLKTIQYLPSEKQQRIAKDTLEIYAPIANRLGMGDIRDKLEDLSFKILYPNEYEWLGHLVSSRFQEKTRYLKSIQRKISHELTQKYHIPILSVHGRTKHLYSLYRKLLARDRDITKIYDLIALRVVVNTVGDCYTVLGVIHTLWRPLKGRIKDYIAQPKPNGYQSLHTTVFCDDGEIVEFQIRTQTMHDEAEYGITAHWHYDERGAVAFDRKLSWAKELSEWHHRIQDSHQLVETVKMDVFRNRIFVFTPQGDAIDLPEDSTPVDFAYHIHTDLGNQCVAAKVNDRLCSLDTALHNGDVVEILVNKQKRGPDPVWLEFVHTATARNKIKAHLRKKTFDRIRRILTTPAM